jgi:hypothetical protein
MKKNLGKYIGVSFLGSGCLGVALSYSIVFSPSFIVFGFIVGIFIGVPTSLVSFYFIADKVTNRQIIYQYATSYATGLITICLGYIFYKGIVLFCIPISIMVFIFCSILIYEGAFYGNLSAMKTVFFGNKPAKKEEWDKYDFFS